MTSSPPRAIEGSVGSKIRVILGNDGNEWLLILNHDDGNRKWQTHHWSNIPSKLAKQLNNCTAKDRYVTQVDFGGAYGAVGWFVRGQKRDGTGDYAWSGGLNDAVSSAIKEESFGQIAIGDQDDEDSLCTILGENGYQTRNVNGKLLKRIKRINKRKKEVEFVRLFHDGYYFIQDDEGTEWVGLGQHCEKEVRKMAVNDVAFAKDGSWVIIGPDSYAVSTGVPDDLITELDAFYNQQRIRQQNRRNAIESYHARIRAEREAAEEARREAVRREQEQREREERERRDREAAELIARREAERVEKAEKIALKRRLAEKESKLEEQLVAEKESISEMEKHLETMQDHLRSRKIALQTLAKELPATKREKFEFVQSCETKNERNHCVVCHDAEPVRAAVPCGHLCLCEQCGPSLASSPDLSARTCPLCREPLQSTLRIFRF